MLTNISKKIELVANLAITLVACLLGMVLIKNYLLIRPPEQSPNKTGNQPVVSQPTVSSLDIDWKQNKQTLILAISSSCHFCSESAQFYQKLAQSKHETRIVAILPQPVDDGRRYLARLGVSVDEIRQASLDRIGVTGTPTLLLVDASGAVKNSWVGKLPAEKEVIVLDALKGKG